MFAIILFLNGLAVMLVEMAGARLLAPWLGTSIIVWASLIGVILSFLSLGNLLGGHLADKILSQKDLECKGKQTSSRHNPYVNAQGIAAWIMLCIAGSLLGAGLGQNILFSSLSKGNYPLHLASLAASAALFGMPALLSGMLTLYPAPCHCRAEK